MRPYLAIIVDSFRAAIASRVLYIMLALITLLFLAVGPLHLTETLDWRLNQHFEKADAIVARLIERGETGRTKSTTRVWSLLSKETQDTVRKLYKNKDKASDRQADIAKLVDELNGMIESPSFYREDDWDRFSKVPEAKSLLADGFDNLSLQRKRRLNRLLMGKAIPSLSPPEAAAINVHYWFIDTGWTFNLSQQQINYYVSTETTRFFDKFVLSIGLLVGIVVTANVIPQMFDPGSLNLLLSKPITRSGLYLTRFAGGCTQIAICTAYLFIGTWLWLGLAIGVWDSAFLWSIPIYVLVFAIYYSISALIGLLYRSPILAVVATVVFWAVCFSVGTGHGCFHALMQNQRLYDPLVTENGVVAINGLGEIVVWNANSKSWSLAAQNTNSPNKVAAEQLRFFFKLKRTPNQIRPAIDPDSRKVVAGVTLIVPSEQLKFTRYNGYTSNLDLKQFASVGDFPQNSMAMFTTNTGMLLCDHNGKFKRWTPSQNARINAKSVGPDKPARIETAYSVAMNASNQEIAIHEFEDGQHHIVVFKPTDDGYVRDRSGVIDVATGDKIKCFLAYANNTLIAIAGNGRVVGLDATSMQPLPAMKTCETNFGIETIAASPDGKWIAMVYGNQQLWLMDVDNDRKLYRPSVTGCSNVSSVSFDTESRLCVVDRENRLTVYETATLQSVKELAPNDSWFETTYRYLLSPLYTVFPKPGEFHKVTNYLSSTRDTANNPAADLIFEPTEPHPLSPLWSGLGFMVFMLGLSCWIFGLKDF